MIQRVIDRFGDTFTVESVPSLGLFWVASAAEAAAFLSESEIAAAAKPILSAIVAADESVEVTDEMEWNGATFTVARVHPLTWRDQVIAKRLILV